MNKMDEVLKIFEKCVPPTSPALDRPNKIGIQRQIDAVGRSNLYWLIDRAGFDNNRITIQCKRALVCFCKNVGQEGKRMINQARLEELVSLIKSVASEVLLPVYRIQPILNARFAMVLATEIKGTIKEVELRLSYLCSEGKIDPMEIMYVQRVWLLDQINQLELPME